MNKAKAVFLSLSVIILISVSCTKQGPAGPAGPAGPSLTGAISGFVTLYDQYGEVMSNDSGVIVTVVGKNISAATNASGRYILTGLSTGSYDITYTKAGYGPTESISVNFVGGDTFY